MYLQHEPCLSWSRCMPRRSSVWTARHQRFVVLSHESRQLGYLRTEIQRLSFSKRTSSHHAVTSAGYFSKCAAVSAWMKLLQPTEQTATIRKWRLESNSFWSDTTNSSFQSQQSVWYSTEPPPTQAPSRATCRRLVVIVFAGPAAHIADQSPSTFCGTWPVTSSVAASDSSARPWLTRESNFGFELPTGWSVGAHWPCALVHRCPQPSSGQVATFSRPSMLSPQIIELVGGGRRRRQARNDHRQVRVPLQTLVACRRRRC